MLIADRYGLSDVITSKASTIAIIRAPIGGDHTPESARNCSTLQAALVSGAVPRS
jgi:hypothetical protein